MNNYRESQSGNQSNYRIIVTYEHNGWGSFSGATQFWSANGGPWNYSGNFTIPAGVNIGLLNTTYSIGHDANGNLGSFSCSCWIDTNHASIGDGGGTVWEPAPPRIPKVPAAPTPVGIDQVTSTTFRYRFTGNDDGGASIIQWNVEVSLTSDFAVADSVVSNGTTVVENRTPGSTYYVRSIGLNSVGWGSYSSTLSVVMLAVGPSAPLSLTAVASPPDTITVDWAVPSSNGGKAITGYEVQASTVAGFNSGVTTVNRTAAQTDAVLTGLTPGSSYYVRVRGENVDANGTWATIGPVQIPAGGKVWTGSLWKSSLWKVWTGSLWKVALVKVWTGSLWKVSK
jgi:hypothetical protein